MIVAALSLEPAFARDLTEPPPDIDAVSPPAQPTPAAKKPQSAKGQKHGEAARKDKSASKDKARASALGGELPRSPPLDPGETAISRKESAPADPLSLDMNWKASNQPIYGGVSTSGMIDRYNETVNGQSLGSGAEVGVKYKF